MSRYQARTLRPILLGLALLSAVYAAPILKDASKPLCRKANWHDVVIFFLANFVAHVATIPQPPGSSLITGVAMCVTTFLLPFSALASSVWRLAKHFKYGRNDTYKAIVTGAVCTVNRSLNWKPDADSDMKVFLHTAELDQCIKVGMADLQCSDDFTKIEDAETYKIHGHYSLPPGYELRILSVDDSEALFLRHIDSGTLKLHIARSQSLIKMAVGLAQLIYTCITLYQTRGNQVSRFGYAAFGLYVFPYAFMSLVNIFTTGFTGDYPYIYMARTPLLEEAERRGGIFDGALGELKKDILEKPAAFPLKDELVTMRLQGSSIALTRADGSEHVLLIDDGPKSPNLHFAGDTHDFGNTEGSAHFQAMTQDEDLYMIVTTLAMIIATAATPYGFIYGLTHFQKQDSTLAQRAWLTAWLVANQVSVIWPGLVFGFGSMRQIIGSRAAQKAVLPAFVLLAVPAIGGMVVIVQELISFPTCVYN